MFTSIAGLPVSERLLTFAGQSTQSTSNAVHVLFPKQPAAAARWPIVVELFGAEGGGNSRENLPTTANARCSLDDLPLCSALTALPLPSAIHPTDSDVRISLIGSIIYLFIYLKTDKGPESATNMYNKFRQIKNGISDIRDIKRRIMACPLNLG